MTDDDIDTRLRDHGTAWRAANQDRPAVDWNAVTTSRRPRASLAVVGVSVAAAAIIVPLVLTAGGRSTTSPKPAIDPTPSPTKALTKGPVEMFGIVATGVMEVGGGRTWISRSTKTPVASLGVGPNDRVAYSTSATSGCRTTIQATFFPPPSTHGNGVIDSGVSQTVATVGFGQDFRSIPPTPIAVSPGGTKLAFEANRVLDAQTGRCVPGERLVVVTLATRQVQSWSAPSQDVIRNLAWSPNGVDIAYLIGRGCRFLSYSVAGCGDSYDGTHVLALATKPDLESTPMVLPWSGHDGGEVYGPVFWWHGELVTVFKGGLMRIEAQGRLHQVTGNFPMQVDTVSSDRTGNHLLLTSGATTYRWDNGHLSVVKGQWTQPGW